MKKVILFTLSCLFILVPAFSQIEQDSGLLFPQFEEGVVVEKDGTRFNVLLNYNTILEEMLFTDGDNILRIAQPENIAIVNINDRIFEYASRNAFYERINFDGNYLYVRIKNKILSKGKAVGYGGYSQTSSVTSINEASFSSAGNPNSPTTIKLKVDEKFDLQNDNRHLLKIKDKFIPINSLSSLTKVFNKNKPQIEEFAKTEKINFNNTDDVKKIVAYSYQLTKK